MIRKTRTPAALTLAALVGLAAATGVVQAHSAGETPPQACEIAASGSGGTLSLAALYHADTALQGSYRFSVVGAGGAGRTQINQGGGFSAAAGETVTLGRLALNGGSTYEVVLSIESGGGTYTCSGRFGA